MTRIANTLLEEGKLNEKWRGFVEGMKVKVLSLLLP
jgi:hypothetical protein